MADEVKVTIVFLASDRKEETRHLRGYPRKHDDLDIDGLPYEVVRVIWETSRHAHDQRPAHADDPSVVVGVRALIRDPAPAVTPP